MGGFDPTRLRQRCVLASGYGTPRGKVTPCHQRPEFLMTFDLQRILESKRALRRSLAQCPVAEKLALLDVLRERTRAIRAAATARAVTKVREAPSEARARPRNP